MKKPFLLLLIVMLSAGSVHAFWRKATVKLDYRQKKTWQYSPHYHSDCMIKEPDSTSVIQTSVFCVLNAVPQERGDWLVFTVDSVSVLSEFYDDDTQKSIGEKLDGGSFGVALIDGCPVVDTLTTFSVREISEWDMVIQFAKLLPDMPYRPVRKGYIWENYFGVLPPNSGDRFVDTPPRSHVLH